MALVNKLIKELQNVASICESIYTVEKSQIQYVKAEANKLFMVSVLVRIDCCAMTYYYIFHL